MKRLLALALVVLSAVFAAGNARAQFKEDAFNQQYNNDKANPGDSADVMFSFKDFFGGVSHKHPIKIGTMFAGSMILPGTGQIYNRDYWKLPLVYGGIGAGVGMGLKYRSEGNDRMSTLCFAAAGLTYWGMLLDETISFREEPVRIPHPGKATIYSLMFPGLGQAYLGDWWRIPIYWGGMLGSAHFFFLNRRNYQRFRNIYQELTNTEIEYNGPPGLTAETALYYRNLYRRYRDYSVLSFAAFYLLQVIDANVFSYMHDFDMSDDISLSLEPAVIPVETSLASASPAFGMRFGLYF
mgnify:CR=1 FL=1